MLRKEALQLSWENKTNQDSSNWSLGGLASIHSSPGRTKEGGRGLSNSFETIRPTMLNPF